MASSLSHHSLSVQYVFKSRWHGSFHVVFGRPLPFPWYIGPRHFLQYAFVISLHGMSLQVQSSLRDICGSLWHSRCPSYVFVPDLVFACHTVYDGVSTLASSSRLSQSVFLGASLYPTFLSLVALLVKSQFCGASSSVSLASFCNVIIHCISSNFYNLVPLAL